MSEVIVHSGFRGLRYVDGRLETVLEPGRYELVRRRFPGRRVPSVEINLIDVRERELNIKGQEILTADKVAVRVNIITHFRVTDPVAAVERVADYSDRLYSDVQLAARRSLASMTLEAILTNRNQLSEDILRDVEGVAAGYGVAIIRADVKDLVFPGNLQEVMNRVLMAQRIAEAQMVEARTRAEREALEATSKADAERVAAQARVEKTRLAAEADAEAKRIRADADVDALRRLAAGAEAYAQHPALLRLRELETLGDLGSNAAARLYIGFEKHSNTLDAD
ncbi:slipin family protein [Actinoplanes sp. TBRC 11911]|uniref:slipin family protein n=1 Tax=Actinoplanes sp. TBRC 11911 TaxID=2729386 RepID=UPI00145CAB18|nr:slipin family protein [Actinoplanes sp. TBRC 11911]NMO55141.1 slipin family protein [Actinoplanes sp. TBRC 11911]